MLKSVGEVPEDRIPPLQPRLLLAVLLCPERAENGKCPSPVVCLMNIKTPAAPWLGGGSAGWLSLVLYIREMWVQLPPGHMPGLHVPSLIREPTRGN